MFDVEGMNPITSHQGALFKDNIHLTNCIGFTFKAAAETKECRVLGQQGVTSRIRNIKFSGDMKLYKNSPWLYNYVKRVIKDRTHAPFDLQGIVDDPDSDFYRMYGAQLIVLKSCVLTGDLTLMDLNTNCDDVEETVSFNAETME